MKNLRGDLFGGLTAGIVALPLALAFGVSSGLGASAGLYGAIIISFLAALLGGTNTQISGPTAPMTALSMVIVTSITLANNGIVDQALPLILLVFLLAGLIQILFGVLGFGKNIKYIPYPVVSGFMTAIGVIILITQFQPILGYDVKEDVEKVESYIPLAEEKILEGILKKEAAEGILVLEDFTETIINAEKITEEEIKIEAETLATSNYSGVLGTIKALPRALMNPSWVDILLALSTILIIYSFKYITKAVPSTLVALLLVTGIASGFELDYITIQEIPQGFPELKLDIFGSFSIVALLPYVAMAITLALLGGIDSLLTSVIADNMTKTRHKSNKELIGQGIGNSIAALFGGIPGAGATIRTVVNIQSGGRTKISGMISSVVLLLILLVFAPMASIIPAGVLAGILVTVGVGVMDFKGLRAVRRIPKSEVFVMLTVLIIAVLWNLVYAVGIGLVLSSLFFMKKMGDLSKKYSHIVPLTKEKLWVDEREIEKKYLNKVYIKHLNGPLFFGYTSDFNTLASKIPRNCSLVVFRLDRVSYIDQSGLYAVEDLLIELSQKKIEYAFVGIQEQPLILMKSIGIVNDLVPKDRIFNTFRECSSWLKQRLNGIEKN